MNRCGSCDHWGEWGGHCHIVPVREVWVDGKPTAILVVKDSEDVCDIGRHTPRQPDDQEDDTP